MTLLTPDTTSEFDSLDKAIAADQTVVSSRVWGRKHGSDSRKWCSDGPYG